MNTYIDGQNACATHVNSTKFWQRFPPGGGKSPSRNCPAYDQNNPLGREVRHSGPCASGCREEVPGILRPALREILAQNELVRDDGRIQTYADHAPALACLNRGPLLTHRLNMLAHPFPAKSTSVLPSVNKHDLKPLQTTRRHADLITRTQSSLSDRNTSYRSSYVVANYYSLRSSKITCSCAPPAQQLTCFHTSSATLFSASAVQTPSAKQSPPKDKTPETTLLLTSARPPHWLPYRYVHRRDYLRRRAPRAQCTTSLMFAEDFAAGIYVGMPGAIPFQGLPQQKRSSGALHLTHAPLPAPLLRNR